MLPLSSTLLHVPSCWGKTKWVPTRLPSSSWPNRYARVSTCLPLTEKLFALTAWNSFSKSWGMIYIMAPKMGKIEPKSIFSVLLYTKHENNFHWYYFLIILVFVLTCLRIDLSSYWLVFVLTCHRIDLLSYWLSLYLRRQVI